MKNSYCIKSMAFARLILKPIVEYFVKISHSGIENIPRNGRFILVSNHRSDLDPLVLGAVVPRFVAWAADAFLFNIPFLSAVLRQLGVIPVYPEKNRRLNAIRNCGRFLSAGQGVGIFPEGHDTIVQGSAYGVGKFYPGFAELALRYKAPIVPISIIPLEEKQTAVQIPDFLARALKLPPDVARTQVRTTYAKVHIEIGKCVAPSLSSGSDSSKKYQINGLVSRTRNQIGTALHYLV